MSRSKCGEVLVLAGQTQEAYHCERRKKGHRKHSARVRGNDGRAFVGKTIWRRVPLT